MMKEKELKEMGELAAWRACLALEKAFGNEFGQSQQRSIDWTSLAEAAFQAGIATASYRVRR